MSLVPTHLSMLSMARHSQATIAAPSRLISLIVIICGLSTTLAARASTPLTLMPLPDQLVRQDGYYPLGEQISVSLGNIDQPSVKKAVLRWSRLVNEQNRANLQAVFTTNNGQLRIHVAETASHYPQPGLDESYRLNIDGNGIVIRAGTQLGVIHALQTLRQLVGNHEGRLIVPQLEIRDRPFLKWRGLLLDTARHFMPLDTVKRLLDAMEMVKLNVLHLHLSDDQGFRVESKTFPLLHLRGTQRGEYYNQAQIRELVDYAADRGIRIVPEFDLPGHSLSLQVAYPQLAIDSNAPLELGTWKGLFSPPIDVSRETTYEFIDTLIGEMASLFPDPCMHIGGDEADHHRWLQAANIQAFMQSQGLSDGDELQNYFTRRYLQVLLDHGKRPIAWQDALAYDLPKRTIIQLWMIQQPLPPSLASHGILVSWDNYLDHLQPAWWLYQRGLADNFPVQDLTEESRRQLNSNILGAEMASWSEHVNAHTLDMRIWPRAAALAERYWSSPDQLDLADRRDFYRRLDAVSRRLSSSGLQHGNLAAQVARLTPGGDSNGALLTLAEAVEPVAEGMADPGQLFKLIIEAALFPGLDWVDPPNLEMTHLWQYLPAESEQARRFGEQVSDYLAGDRSLAATIRHQLERWRDNDQLLPVTIANNPNLAVDQLEVVSRALTEVANIGLQALNILEQRRSPGHWHGWRLESRLDDYDYKVSVLDPTTMIAQAVRSLGKPAPLRRYNIAIQPAVRQLVTATRKLEDNVP